MVEREIKKALNYYLAIGVGAFACEPFQTISRIGLSNAMFNIQSSKRGFPVVYENRSAKTRNQKLVKIGWREGGSDGCE